MLRLILSEDVMTSDWTRLPYGQLAQVLTGLAMAGGNWGEEINSALVSTNLVVAVVVLVVSFLGRRATGNTTKY